MANEFVPKKGTWVNEETGQRVTGYVTLTKVERKDFEIIYFSYLFDLFDKLGGKRFQVLKYILANKSSDNTLIITIRELANATKVSTKTVHETLKLLREVGIIKTRLGAIILNSRFTVHGSKAKEDWIFHKFEIFDQEIED